MNIGTKAGMFALSTGAVGGVAYSGYYHFSKDSFADKLNISVLDLTGEANQKEWVLRIDELNKKPSGLDSSLAEIKSKDWKELQKWCNYQSSTKFNKETDTTYQNFEEFCTWKFLDKAGENIIPSTQDSNQEVWKTAHEKLKKKESVKSTLSPELQKVLEAKEADNSHKVAIHKWCTDNYKKTWKGENDETFKETKEYCKK